MSRNKGKPSGLNKSIGTGVPSKLKNSNLKRDNLITQKYTDDDKSIAGHVRVKNPNRNVDKQDATNAHGYKN
ncbi:MAG TPA: hypothetical protein VFO70_02305, partial [Chitinophagaceae bacterium]|nr:hypothetical protein [Chitinophagaceae bacterium]